MKIQKYLKVNLYWYSQSKILIVNTLKFITFYYYYLLTIYGTFIEF